MTSHIEIRPLSAKDLEAVERLKIGIFSSQPHSAMGRLPLETQIQVRVALNKATGNLPEQTIGAFDGPRLVGVTSFETAENLRFPRWKDAAVLLPLGLFGILRLLFVASLSYYPSNPREAYLHGLAIDADYRRRGIAERLMTATEQQALHMGKDFAVIMISQKNTASLNLVKKLDYHEIIYQRNFLRTFFLGEPEFIRLEKQITPVSHTDPDFLLEMAKDERND
jgi:ribosomal protein S18 acetylase RimI-like enzyme